MLSRDLVDQAIRRCEGTYLVVVAVDLACDSVIPRRIR